MGHHGSMTAWLSKIAHLVTARRQSRKRQKRVLDKVYHPRSTPQGPASSHEALSHPFPLPLYHVLTSWVHQGINSLMKAKPVRTSETPPEYFRLEGTQGASGQRPVLLACLAHCPPPLWHRRQGPWVPLVLLPITLHVSQCICSAVWPIASSLAASARPQPTPSLPYHQGSTGWL